VTIDISLRRALLSRSPLPEYLPVSRCFPYVIPRGAKSMSGEPEFLSFSGADAVPSSPFFPLRFFSAGVRSLGPYFEGRPPFRVFGFFGLPAPFFLCLAIVCLTGRARLLFERLVGFFCQSVYFPLFPRLCDLETSPIQFSSSNLQVLDVPELSSYSLAPRCLRPSPSNFIVPWPVLFKTSSSFPQPLSFRRLHPPPPSFPRPDLG